MSAVRLVTEEDSSSVVVRGEASPSRVFGYIGVSALLLASIGTWLVWFSISVQQHAQEDAIRSACQRVMPDTAERCFDTVIIQRGGIRR